MHVANALWLGCAGQAPPPPQQLLRPTMPRQPPRPLPPAAVQLPQPPLRPTTLPRPLLPLLRADRARLVVRRRPQPRLPQPVSQTELAAQRLLLLLLPVPAATAPRLLPPLLPAATPRAATAARHEAAGAVNHTTVTEHASS